MATRSPRMRGRGRVRDAGTRRSGPVAVSARSSAGNRFVLWPRAGAEADVPLADPASRPSRRSLWMELLVCEDEEQIHCPIELEAPRVPMITRELQVYEFLSLVGYAFSVA
ncbi:hypothetical protein FNF29_05371 [Cafeteria roenbergensis]|uniref:Uncharacterized protein n=1 Tax=Cafeteria roenbergensis TaxID=33653 RepID=A0A5A8D6C1_CAFRO|nr:hypothetical protein FNF29_05371 [Cafeteria roenbergensis]KAA0160708.1 hypothetical protein FNF28_05344 [Cafeteria roenbergensis]|eukprot:KAA0150359.1 hypothetical protein FNF29_05371 [Cafeteria roenbergensis]